MSRLRRPQSNGADIERLSGLVVAFGTVILAAVTAWLAYDTHKLSRLTYEENALERKVVVVRLCDTASREQAKDDDAVIDFKPSTPDGFEYSDRLSKDTLVSQYLRSPANDFVRCQVLNFGHLPLLEVQLAMTASTKARSIRIVTSPFLSIAAGGSGTFWVANNSDTTVTFHSPDRVRYRIYETGDSLLSAAEPKLKDVWVVRPNRPVIEYLDQSQMKPF